MSFKSKPKLIAGLLIGGTLILVGAGAVAAALPAPNRMMQMMALARAQTVAASLSASPTSAAVTTRQTAPAPSTPGSPARTSTPVPTPSASVGRSQVTTAKPSPPESTSLPVKHPQKGSITYVVLPGDNLTVIAAWFKLHGYGDLYAANAKVIGADPNIIKPGERITIANGLATMSPAS